MEKIIKKNVGIDVSKDTFWATVTIKRQDQEFMHLKSKEFPNKLAGFASLESWIQELDSELSELHFTMEATGVYYENLANYLYSKNYFVHVVLPNKAKKYAESLDVKSKTDKLDSKSLGQLGVERKLKRWNAPTPLYKDLRDLTRERCQLIKVRTRFKNNLHALNHAYKSNENRVARVRLMIEALDGQVKEIEKELNNLLKETPFLKEKVENITSISGVAQLTALIVIAETNGFALIENAKQLCSYAGLDVRIRESGKWKGHSKISKQGNSYLRAAMYFPAITAINNNEHFKNLKDRIVKGSRKNGIGITAVSRKLLILIYALWKNDCKYDKDFGRRNVA